MTSSLQFQNLANWIGWGEPIGNRRLIVVKINGVEKVALVAVPVVVRGVGGGAS